MEIINVGDFTVNNYIIKTSKGYIVVDTGYAGNFNRFCKKLKEHRISFDEIKFIFITYTPKRTNLCPTLVGAVHANLIRWAPAKAGYKILLLCQKKDLKLCPRFMLFWKKMANKGGFCQGSGPGRVEFSSKFCHRSPAGPAPAGQRRQVQFPLHAGR